MATRQATRHLHAVGRRGVTPPVTLVDSCVLLDIATDDSQWATWSDEALAKAQDEGDLVINAIIFAEVSVGYLTIEEVEHALPRDDLHREELPYEAAFLAGKAFRKYRQNGGQKRSPMPDFYIGAHAAVAGYRLLTRDATRFKTYFPSVELIHPG